MTGRRITLLHFTAPPAVGGVEALMEAQADVLRAHGDEVTVVTGSGDLSTTYRLVTISEIHPDSPSVRAARSERPPNADHPLVEKIAAQLLPILSSQDQIWVHNAFTVYLNPFLTVALHLVLRDLGEKRWVAFCHDLSAVSRYVDGPAPAPLPRGPDMRYVVLSTMRRQEAASLLDIPEDQIRVIPPPLDVFAWLDLNDEARKIACDTRLLDRDLSLLVPSKLLPHKRIDRAVQAIAALKQKGLNPLLLVTGARSPHEPAASTRVAETLRSLAAHLAVDLDFCIVAENLGSVPGRKTIRDLMSLCDLVFLPSAEEGYGMPISEAIALRVPVICSDIPAFRDAGRDYAMYVNADDSEATAETMIEIARAPGVLRRHEVTGSMARFQDEILHLAQDM